MSEIQSVADPHVVKYLVGGVGFLVGVVNFLGMYILKGIKKTIDGIIEKQSTDHDRLNKIEAEHNLLHKGH